MMLMMWLHSNRSRAAASNHKHRGYHNRPVVTAAIGDRLYGVACPLRGLRALLGVRVHGLLWR